MTGYRLISSDSHVYEPPDLWEQRIDPAFRERAPRLVHEADTDQWYADGDVKFGVVGSNQQAGLRYDDPDKITSEGRFENAPQGRLGPPTRTSRTLPSTALPAASSTPPLASTPSSCLRATSSPPSSMPTTAGWPTSAGPTRTGSRA